MPHAHQLVNAGTQGKNVGLLEVCIVELKHLLAEVSAISILDVIGFVSFQVVQRLRKGGRGQA